MRVLEGLIPKRVFEIFEDICNIPHGSGNTDEICGYCTDFAKINQLPFVRDQYNNVIITKAASAGYERHAPVILQGHLDMVCEKDPDCATDFTRDGLKLCADGGYVKAVGTTLGGDDGIAVAMTLAILEDKSLAHPKIFAVFTADEETGMDGAANIDMSDIDSKTLINIDSEEEGVFTVSCAGGVKCKSELLLQSEENTAGCYEIRIGGLAGGHSGVDIDKGRLNAVKAMAALLEYLAGKLELWLCDISGGCQDNAIPRECTCNVSCDCATDSLTELCCQFSRDFAGYSAERFTPEIRPASSAVRITRAATANVIAFLNTVPNGVTAKSSKIENLVETSLNLGIAICKDDKLYTTFCVRSSVDAKKRELCEMLKGITGDFGGSFSQRGEYPAWEYRENSRLRDVMVAKYTEMFGTPPAVSAIHAGVECGLLCRKKAGLDAVSFGPNILDIHTPKERLEIASVQRTYLYLCNVLKEL